MGKAKPLEPGEISRLLEVMRRLRDPKDGCPWDREQDFKSIAPYTIEEAYEVAEAIDKNDMAALQDELGDLLLQVVYHAQIAAERGHFTFADVVAGVSEKMVRRHPHVFGQVTVADAKAQTEAWEAEKARERQKNKRGGVLDGVAHALPALLRAEKLQKRAARVGFDWDEVEPVFDKIAEEIAEIRAELPPGPLAERQNSPLAEEIGDLFFACVNLSRHFSVDSETALRTANAKFERRFAAIEACLPAGSTIKATPLEQLEALWERVKKEEKSE